jgi:hypothetical protein
MAASSDTSTTYLFGEPLSSYAEDISGDAARIEAVLLALGNALMLAGGRTPECQLLSHKDRLDEIDRQAFAALHEIYIEMIRRRG